MPHDHEILVPLPLIRPDGSGHMTLTAAAYWIATRGGSVTIGIDDTFWEAAYADLLGRIASGEVEIVGREHGSGGGKLVPPQAFVGVRVSYPFGDMQLGDAPFVECFPYVDEQHWSNGTDDRLYLEGRGPVATWTHLMVKKADIARRWPFWAETPTTDRDHSAAPQSTKRRRGRRPTKLAQITEAMRTDLRDKRVTMAKLQDMREKTLVSTYGASRETVRKARAAILSEIVGN